jgi:predicted Zn-dependent protease
MNGKPWPPPEVESPPVASKDLMRLGPLLSAANRGDLRPVDRAISPEYLDAIYAWAVVAFEENRWSDLRLAIDHLADFEPDSARLLRACLAWETATGDFLAMAKTARRLSERYPDDAELVFLWGQAMGMTGSKQEALEVIKAARKIAEADPSRWAHVIQWCDTRSS